MGWSGWGVFFLEDRWWTTSEPLQSALGRICPRSVADRWKW
jgi:hypothetical protein